MKLRTEEAIEILKKYRDWHNDEKMPSELPKPGIYLIGDSLNRAIEVMEESLKAKEKIRVKPLKKITDTEKIERAFSEFDLPDEITWITDEWMVWSLKEFYELLLARVKNGDQKSLNELRKLYKILTDGKNEIRE